jgi:hypothetical protein
MEFDVRVCQECRKAFDEPAQARRHFRVHGMTFEQYWLKWKHGGVRPNCACGCGGQPAWNVALKDYAAYVHGHHMTGREQPAETRRKIGEKNAVNMKRFMDANPEFARAKGIQLRAARTPESELRRLEATRTTYAAMSVDDKRQFSDHAKELWQDGTLKEAHDKASTTWKKRYDAGEYDFTERNERLSQSITQKYLDGGFEWSRGSYTSPKTGETMHYRSSWELEFARLLDEDSDVIGWRYEPFSIGYVHEGVERRYVPDFFVQSSITPEFLLVEVKPQSLQDAGINGAKSLAARQRCHENGWTYRTWSPADGKCWLTV